MMDSSIFTLCEKHDHSAILQLAHKDHPIFQAHFENNPLLPGFLQLDIIASVFAKVVTEIISAKFIHPVLPDTTLYYTLKNDKNERITIKLYDKENIMISNFRVKWSNA